MQIVLIRHAAPDVSPSAPARAWHLSDDGRAAATRLDLSTSLPTGHHTVAVASTEPKAIETLCLALGTATVTSDPRFDEVRRPGEPFSSSFRAARRAWVTGSLDHRHAGWETPEEAARRFDAGVRAHARRVDLQAPSSTTSSSGTGTGATSSSGTGTGATSSSGTGTGTGSGMLVIGTHGMVMTAWLTSMGRVEPGAQAGNAWDELSFPDVVRVDRMPL